MKLASKLSLIASLFIILTLSACSSGKKSGKPGAVGMIYHNITARNNAYFNGNELLKETFTNLEEAHKNDYDEVLTVYPERVPEEAEAQSAAFDEIIKKASRAIKLHEPSKFSDNSYLLVGISYYLKGEHQKALEALQYLSAEYKGDKKKKKSKSKSKKKKKKKKRKSNKPMTAAQLEELEDEQEEEEIEAIQEEKELEEEDWDGKKSFKEYLTHQLSRPKAMVWMTNIYTDMEKYKEAETVLTVIEGEPTFPGYLANEVARAKAHLYIQKGDFSRAIPPLQEIDENIKRNKKKIRYLYILAQLYERDKDYTNAVEKYKEVLKARPVYDMEFNAKMSLARIAGTDGSSYSEIKKLLTKLLKDSKNKEFFDQVYYALAELELNQNNRDQALEYLEKSIEASVNNNDQLAKSYIKQAELYYQEEAYVKAQPGYKNASGLISEEHPKADEIQTRADALTELITQLQIIEEKDSLLQLASLSEAELEEYIEKELAKREAELEEEEEQKFALNSQNRAVSNNGSSNQGSDGQWYFYNNASKSRGYNEFIQVWGKRKLEDNWRRSDKESEGSLEEIAGQDPVVGEEGTEEEGFDYIAERDAIMASLPLKEEDQAVAKKTIIEAYFKIGNIYKFEINNTQKAIESFEELFEKYPNNKYRAEVCYNLHLLHKEVGNDPKAAYYRDIILNEYPNSEFAKILRDPGYLDKKKKQSEQVDRYYENTYAHFTAGNYEQVILASAKADTMFEFNHLAPKFALLTAFSKGKTDSLDTYIASLENISKDYPGTHEAQRAEELIEILEKSENKTYEKAVNIREYKREMDALHYVMAVYDKEKIKGNDLSVAISRFNTEKRSLENLKTNTLVLNEEHAMVVIKYFEGEGSVRKYFDAIRKDEAFFNDFPNEALDFYFITDINFNKVVINQELNSYLEYFNKNYKDW